MPTTKGHHVHVVPMLSPVLEDFVPPLFRGNVPDDAQSPTTISAAATGNATATVTATATATVTEAPSNWFEAAHHRKAPMESEGEEVDTGIRSRVALMLLHWRKRVERGPVHVPVQKPVQVQGLRRQSPKKSSKSRRAVGHFLNPLSLLAKLRDTYIHVMNGVATSGIVASGPIGDSSAQHSTLFFSREFDAESIAQLVELERSGSKVDSDYRQQQNMACARNSSRVKPCGDVPLSNNKSGVNFGAKPVLSRSKSTRNQADVVFFGSGRRLAGEPALSRSKSNSFSDEVFFSRKLKGSRKKKLHVNPYADSDWKADTVLPPKAESKVGPNDFHFQRENVNAGTESRTEYRLQQSASTGSLFVYKH